MLYHAVKAVRGKLRGRKYLPQCAKLHGQYLISPKVDLLTFDKTFATLMLADSVGVVLCFSESGPAVTSAIFIASLSITT